MPKWPTVSVAETSNRVAVDIISGGTSLSEALVHDVLLFFYNDTGTGQYLNEVTVELKPAAAFWFILSLAY